MADSETDITINVLQKKNIYIYPYSVPFLTKNTEFCRLPNNPFWYLLSVTMKITVVN